ncbi:MAG: TMEM175 family protein [Candidatus Moraniibacteriota bacterium]
MNKFRLEALSDGVFAIVMTLLVIEITVPEIHHPSDTQLWLELQQLGPLFVSYFVSFTVLAMFWISHNFFYGAFTKVVNRQLVLLNMFYLSFVSLIPFSAHFLGSYPDSELAVLVYGCNVFLLGAASTAVLQYAIHSEEIDTSHITQRILAQARIRSYLIPAMTLIGIIAIPFSLSFALFCYAFPILFNIVPGLLNWVEQKVGLNFGD